MPQVALYCQVHQPYRLRRYRVFDIGTGAPCFDDEQNRAILRRVADKCYIPANRLLAQLIRETGGEFRLAMSLSGAVVEQMALWAPDALESFQDLVATGGVELLGETYYHSLSALADPEEFTQQVTMHRRAIRRWFGQHPTVFRNTELILSDEIAARVRALGYQGMLGEGAGHALGWRSPNHVYGLGSAPGLRLMLRNYRLSDDVAFRFSNRAWDGWPLRAETYADWLAGAGGDSVHLFMDYETFGEHQWADTGIFEFLRHLPGACLQRGVRFTQPGILARRFPVDALSFSRPTSWADEDRDLSAWLGNRIQQAAHERLYRLRGPVLASGDPQLIDRWRRLTTSDHVYYMCTKWFADGDVHKYFSPYDSPYDAFVAFMNVLQDLEQRTGAQPARPTPALAAVAA